MKNSIRIAILAVCLVVCVVAFTACNIGAEKLTQPSNFAYNGESLVWDAVEGAEGYEISINGGEKITVTALNYLYDANNQEFTASIRSLSEHGEKYHSEEYSVNFKPLGNVNNIHMNTDGYLQWDVVENATAYIVSVNNTEYTVDVNEFSNFVGGLNAIRVKAIVKGDNSYYSKWSQISTYNMLEIPKNLKYDNTTDIITWDTVRNAVNYTLKINNEEIICDSNSYQYTPDVGVFEISVRANVADNVQNAYPSAFCEKIDYTLLQPITNLEEKDGGVTWSLVEGAKYQIEVKEGGRVVSYTTLTEPSFSDFDPSTLYTVRVRIFPQNEREFSTWSDAFSVYFLASPNVEVIGQNGEMRLSFDISVNNGETAKVQDVTVQISKPDGSKLVENVSLGTYSQYDFNDGAGEYTFSVKANPKTLDGYFEFSSKYSQAIKIVRLEDVTNVTMTDKSYISFKGVVGASGYRYLADGQEYQLGKDTMFMPDIDNSDGMEKTVTISIYALGSDGKASDGKYYLGSSSAKQFTVTKLATVTELEPIDNRVQWTGVSNASKYELTVGGASYYTSGTIYNLSIDSAGEHIIRVKAVGNPSAFIMDGDYSDILTVYKLATPFVTGITAEGMLSWTYQPIAGTQTFGEGYQITVGSVALGTQISLDVRQFDLSQNIFLSPQSVHIVVKGNGREVLDSEPSTENISVAKLDVIKNLTVQNATESIVWDAVDNANQYRFSYSTSGLKDYKDTQTTAFNELNGWKAGEYSVSVRALGYKTQNGNTYYVQSDEVTAIFRKLAQPEVNRQGNAYVWDSVSYAQNGYSVTRPDHDTELATTDGQKWTYVPNFNRTDINTSGVKLTFRTNGDDASGLIASNKVEIVQKISAISKPSVSVEYVNTDLGTKAFKITANSVLLDGAKYAFNINGTEIAPQESNVYVHEISDAREYSYAVVVKGGFFQGETYYVDSVVSETVKRTVLQPVKDIDYSYSNGTLTVTWTNPNSGDCSVSVDVGNVVATDRTSCKITGVNVGDTVKVIITVKGNNSTTFDSKAIEYLITIR